MALPPDPRPGTPPSRLPRLLVAVGTAIAALTTMAPALLHPMTVAAGHPLGETTAHVWGLATTASGLWDHGPFLRVAEVDLPAGFRAELLDPVSLLAVAPLVAMMGPVAGAVAGWNLLHLVALVLCAWGTWTLARSLALDPWTAALAALGAVCAPGLLAGLPMGRSELLPLVWLPVVLACGERVAQGGARGWKVAAALSIAALVHGGPLAVLWGAPVLIGWALWRGRSRDLLLCWLAGAALCVPYLLNLADVGPWWTARLGVQDFAGAQATDLARVFRLAGRADTPVFQAEVPPYPGVVLLLGAALGAALAPRRAGPWAAAGVLLWLLSLGPGVRLGELRTGGLVAGLAAVLPPLKGVTGWGRLAMGVGPLLALAVAMGLHRRVSVARRPVAVLVVSGLCLLDAMTWRPLGPAAGVDLAPTPAERAVSEALADSADAVLVLPIDGLATAQAQVLQDRSLWRAHVTGRGTSEAPSPLQASAFDHSVLARALDDVPRARSLPCADTEVARLNAAGFGAVVLELGRLRTEEHAAAQRILRGVLGAPQLREATVHAWRLPPSTASVPDACAPPLTVPRLDGPGAVR